MLLPTLSVVLPSYNRTAYLAEALQSVMAQGYPHVGSTVVDNRSTASGQVSAQPPDEVPADNVSVKPWSPLPQRGVHLRGHGLRRWGAYPRQAGRKAQNLEGARSPSRSRSARLTSISMATRLPSGATPGKALALHPPPGTG
jgi:hypothetical protein